MELNREQIIKALECCKSSKLTKCNGCPREQEDGHCMYRLTADALALIREQAEEIERLIAESAKEFTCAFASPHKVADCPLPDEVAKAKADTVRKMQERLEASCDAPHWCVWLGEIEQIAKEMLEEE